MIRVGTVGFELVGLMAVQRPIFAAGDAHQLLKEPMQAAHAAKVERFGDGLDAPVGVEQVFLDVIDARQGKIFFYGSLPGAKDAAEIVGANFQGGGDVGAP